MPNKLTQVVRSSLDDLIGMYYEGGLSNASKETIIELFEALKENGEDVTEHEEDYASVVEDMDESLIVPRRSRRNS